MGGLCFWGYVNFPTLDGCTTAHTTRLQGIRQSQQIMLLERAVTKPLARKAVVSNPESDAYATAHFNRLSIGWHLSDPPPSYLISLQTSHITEQVAHAHASFSTLDLPVRGNRLYLVDVSVIRECIFDFHPHQLGSGFLGLTSYPSFSTNKPHYDGKRLRCWLVTLSALCF